MNSNSKFSQRLAEEVEKKGISLRRLEEMTGISRSTLSRYTSGISGRVPISKLQKIADALNISSAYLACWTDDPHFTLEEEKENPPVEADELKVIIDSLSEEKRKELERYAKYLASLED